MTSRAALLVQVMVIVMGTVLQAAELKGSKEQKCEGNNKRKSVVMNRRRSDGLPVRIGNISTPPTGGMKVQN